ncbi:hypothetical protein KDH_35190 [Dictyobacter sp. S3.2.2.5]|uniref:Uncharacterized protein n=1 Tax=Dictyobacter halimunensis TaxID=3026934 RepID=A0ABQ6FSM0_9CHLR|nr:hypothetical protein KDH_35190 [Dictyobacter sp. S3.2.2.5]
MPSSPAPPTTTAGTSRRRAYRWTWWWGNLSANIENAKRILQKVAQKLPADRSAQTCICEHALASTIMTDPARIPAEVKEKYDLLIGRYIS